MRRTALLAAAGALLLSCCCIRSAAAQANAPLIPGENGGWRQGRATFYGGPERFLQNFKDRGPPPEYGFGDAIFGSCGYTQQVGGTAAVQQDCVHAMAHVTARLEGRQRYQRSARCIEMPATMQTVTEPS